MRAVGLDYATLDAGLLWRAAPGLTLGLMLKNLADVHRSGYVRTTTGKITTLAVAVEKGEWRFSCDQEVIYGHFGGLEKKKAECWLMRAGVERTVRQNTFLRAGLIIPVIARTSSLGNIRNDLPTPGFGATIGAGIVFRHVSMDFALTGNPGRSYVEQDIRLQAVFSISLML